MKNTKIIDKRKDNKIPRRIESSNSIVFGKRRNPSGSGKKKVHHGVADEVFVKKNPYHTEL